MIINYVGLTGPISIKACAFNGTSPIFVKRITDPASDPAQPAVITHGIIAFNASQENIDNIIADGFTEAQLTEQATLSIYDGAILTLVESSTPIEEPASIFQIVAVNGNTIAHSTF